MDSATPNLDEDLPGIRKRKWSPLKDESEDESFTGRSATEARGDSATPGTPLGSDIQTYHKRPRIQEIINPSSRPQATTGPSAKEIPRVPRLPLELWQQVCSFLEPVSLGRLICVDRSLNELLDPNKPVPEPLRLKNLTQNDIWLTSRKRLLPGFPRPPSWISELDMWKLLLGNSCQFCGRKTNKLNSSNLSPWTSGPGQESVRIIWPFTVHSCGKCLTTRMTKDADLRFSDVSILLSGLPYAYFTSDLNFATSVAIRASSPPLGLDLTRYYFQPQVDQLKHEMDQASSFGRAAAEEWVKGLDDVGRQRMEDAKRFEHWEATGGLQALLRSRAKIISPPKHGLPAKPALPALSTPSLPSHIQAQSNSAGSRTQSPLSAQYKPSPPNNNHFPGFSTPYLPPKPASPAPGQIPPSHPQPSTSMANSQGPRGRLERNPGDVNRRRAERCAEIERRCLQLDPPIKSSTLPYMDAFNNAMLIPTALNDNAWEVLKPRLVAQHDSALKKEQAFLAMNKHFQPQADQRRENEEQLRQAQTLLERQRDEAQRPVREKLAAYADELLKSDWDDGGGVVKENAPQFAADLLIYVRRKFFKALEENDKLLEAQRPSTAVTSQGTSNDRHLTLEDMKWVYENKIKPITKRYSKEIFLCGACDVDRKHYALDAVIQHYAAKHTHAFSHGSATVYWKAEWPLEPPFDPNPIHSPRPRPVDHNGLSPMYQRDFGRPQYVDPIFAVPEQTHPYSARPGVIMTPDMAHRPLPRYATSVYPVDEEAYQSRSRLVPVQAGIARPPIYGNGAYETYYVSAPPASPAFSAQGLIVGPYRERPAEPYQRPYAVHRYDSSVMSPVGMNGYAVPPPQVIQRSRHDLLPLIQPGQPSGFHQTQITELARNAKEIWDSTVGIDNLPDSVRTHVIIHHVVLRFRDRYTNEPTLALFTDALLNNSQMRPLIDLTDLVCKACFSHDKFTTKSDQHPSYKLPDLLKHFQAMHMLDTAPPMAAHAGLEIPRPDWKFDMVQLPNERTIKDLIYSPGMTDGKLSLIATVLSRHFPYPLPRLDRAHQVDQKSAVMPPTDEIAPPFIRLASSSLPREDSRDYIPLEEHVGSMENLPAVSGPDQPQADFADASATRDDEYDPHRPAPTRPVPVMDYAHDQQGMLNRESLRARDIFDSQGIPPPPYAVNDSKYRSFYSEGFLLNAGHRDDRRRYIGEEDDLQRRYVPAPSQYLYRPAPGNGNGFEDDRDRGRAHSPTLHVKIEAARSPARRTPLRAAEDAYDLRMYGDSADDRNPTTGTAQFLSNFDVGEVPVDGSATLPEASPPDRASNNASSNRNDRAAASTRHFRDRLDAHQRPGTGVTSRRGTPRKAISRGGVSAHSRSPSVLPRVEPRIREEPHVRRTADVPIDREPIQQAQYADARYVDRLIYQDDIVPQHYEPVNRYRTRSPGQVSVRYVEGRPFPQYRYSEEDMYEQSGREYVQVMPREGTQYVEQRVIENQFPEYVADDGAYGRPPDERNGQGRIEPPPSRRGVRYDAYDNRRRYQ